MNNRIQKGHKPTAISEVPGAKAGYCGMIPAHSTTTEVSRPPKVGLLWTHRPDPSITPFKDPQSFSQGIVRTPVSCFCSLELQK